MPKMKRRDLYEVTCTVEGKRYHFYGKSKNEAIHKRDAFREQAEKAPLSLEGYMLAEWVAAWLITIKNDVSPQTYSSYMLEMRKYIITAMIGAVRLSDLKPMMFRNYWQKLIDDGLSPRTVSYIHTITSSSLKQAVMDGALIANPLLAVKRPRQVRKQVTALDPEQIAHLKEVITDAIFKRLVHVALATGLRRGELQALTWDDIDFKECRLSVNQSVIREDGHEVVSTALKTKSSRRTITIDEKTVKILQSQKAYCQSLMLQNRWQGIHFVFPREDGSPMRQNTISKKFSQYCKDAGIEGATFHSLRHTHATELVKAGIHFKIIQSRLGHSSFAITMDTYSHIAPGEDREAAEAIKKVL